MSVVDPRPAAAQRTAASRIRIVATWLVAVPMLAFFSFSVVAGASTYGDQTAPIQNAVAQLPATTTTVVEAPAATSGSMLDQLTHVMKLVCTVNAAQRVTLQHTYRTSTSSLSMNGRTVSVLSVYGATETAIRGYLGNANCVLVQMSRVYFLPFDAHTS